MSPGPEGRLLILSTQREFAAEDLEELHFRLVQRALAW